MTRADAQALATSQFDRADTNHDGNLTVAEARANKDIYKAENAYIKPETIQLCAKNASSLTGGNPEEKMKAMPDDKVLMTKQKFLDAHDMVFNHLDTNKDGIVTQEEVDAADQKMAAMCKQLPDMAKLLKSQIDAAKKHGLQQMAH